jgi:metal-responsive CopG/Arc/MetJ family transcriptional regulator
MKTQISIPKTTYASVSDAAKRLRISRSAFFARAAKRYLRQLQRAELTPQINRALGEIESQKLDPVVARHAKKMLLKVEW